MTKGKAIFLFAEVASFASAALGLALMVLGRFEGEGAVWGLFFVGLGVAGFAFARWIRRELGVRFRRRRRR